MKQVISTLLLFTFLTIYGCGGGEEPSSNAGAVNQATLADLSSDEIDRLITLFNKGVGLMDRYQPEEAVNIFEQVVILAPGWTTGRLNLAIALLNTQGEENIIRAEKEFNKVINSDKDNLNAHYTYGILLRHLTRFDEAALQFEYVLRIDPEDADAHYQLATLIDATNPEKAKEYLEFTLKKVPHHESACYRLQALLRRAGETERANELLLRFQALKQSGAGVFSGMKYGEMGKYAEVIRTIDLVLTDLPASRKPDFKDIAAEKGLTIVSSGSTGWPGLENGSFGPGVAAYDIDGDGDIDICITSTGTDKKCTLYLNDNSAFNTVEDSGIDAINSIGAYFGDYDKDGDPDLFLTCDGSNAIYNNDGNGNFTNVTKQSGIKGGEYLSIGAAWADADHDGDLDLYVTNYSSSDSNAPNKLWRNNGNGTFVDVAMNNNMVLPGAASIGVLFFDVDADRDLDLYVLNHNDPNRLFINDRVGEYTEASAIYSIFMEDEPTTAALTGDINTDGLEDILLLRGELPPRLLLQLAAGHFVEDTNFNNAMKDTGGAVSATIGDFDLDGDLDLILLDSGAGDSFTHKLLINRGDGNFEKPLVIGQERIKQSARGAIAFDTDGNGSLEILVANAGGSPQLWQTETDVNKHWLVVTPTMKADTENAHWIDPSIAGMFIEIKTGRKIQVRSVSTSSGYLGSSSLLPHFGLNDAAKADYVRMQWPDAVLQSEIEIPADQRWQVTKVARKPSSCPILFVWSGERYEYITDFLGVGGVGFFISPGVYAPPDPTEDVRIPPDFIQIDETRLRLRVAEPLEEVTYLDQLYLFAYDHPTEWEIYPDERFTGTPPFPTGDPIAVKDKIFPVNATTDSNADVLSTILEIDRQYVEPPVDKRFVGYADDHWVELDFGDQLEQFDDDSELILHLYGWVEYTYSHINYAAYQAGLIMQSPYIEVPDGNGGWKIAVTEMGFPAGLPRMMNYNISSLDLKSDSRLRIRSNMEIFWDQIFISDDISNGEVKTHTLKPTVADLRYLGFPREFSPDGNNPTVYDYHRLDQGVPFKNLSGTYTRLGDVKELLASVDDCFVIMARGEEIALEFDLTTLPDLPAGMSRTFVLHCDGYCKDMDLYTAFPDTVEPLPFHAMDNYPPEKILKLIPEKDRLRKRYNTRHVKDR